MKNNTPNSITYKQQKHIKYQRHQEEKCDSSKVIDPQLSSLSRFLLIHPSTQYFIHQGLVIKNFYWHTCFLMFSREIYVPFWDKLKKNLTLKAKHKIKKNISWLFFSSFSFVFSHLLPN
jgi:hypothetical protein